MDISYSYLDLDACQKNTDDSVSLSLNTWLRVNGIYNQFYYIFLLISYFKFKPYADNNVRNISYYFDSIIHCFKFTLLFFTVISLTFLCVGFYSFISYYSHICNNKSIIFYMWVRLIIGLISYISMLVIIPYYIIP